MRRVLPAFLLAVAPVAQAGGDYKVVGGAPVTDASWPDAVALFSGDNFSCTGVLVAPDVVLTAAHCDFALSTAIVGPRDYDVDGESIPVAETFSHPQSWMKYDVAAVVLERAAVATPRALALDCIAQEEIVDGADVAIVGYGATDQDATEWTTLLHEARTTVIDADCSNLDEGCNVGVSPGGELIAGGQGIDSCNGDSGGPLYLITPQGDFLVGTTSRATGSADVACGDGGIYVRADAIAEWIEEVTGRTLPRPDCTDWNHAPEPTHDPASVRGGESVAIAVHANDPDPGDHHVWTLVSPPAFGNASVALDGTVIYSARYSDYGPTSFVVQVEDDGTPPRSATLEVAVDVLEVPIHPPDPNCGCGGGSVVTAPWIAAIAALVRRRRASGA